MQDNTHASSEISKGKIAVILATVALLQKTAVQASTSDGPGAISDALC